MAYLIQGFFFQSTQSLGTGYRHDGVAVTIREGIGAFHFAGAVHPVDDDPDSFWWEGEMEDTIGRSQITDWNLGSSTLTFKKKYLNDPMNLIHYQFDRQKDGTWVGTYGGERARTGYARCIITEVSSEFFQRPVPKAGPAT